MKVLLTSPYYPPHIGGIEIHAMKNIPARLVVLGEGEDKIRFEKRAKKLGVCVEFRGKVSDSELKDWMRKARVLVLPAQSSEKLNLKLF